MFNKVNHSAVQIRKETKVLAYDFESCLYTLLIGGSKVEQMSFEDLQETYELSDSEMEELDEVMDNN